MTLLDTGPLVALLDARERRHRWAVEAFAAVEGPLATCEAVLTETCFLLRRWPEAFEQVLERVEDGVLKLAALGADGPALRKLMRKYSDVPITYADAYLVRLSEKLPGARVLTLDRDFEVYRRNGREVIPLLAPF